MLMHFRGRGFHWRGASLGSVFSKYWLLNVCARGTRQIAANFLNAPFNSLTIRTNGRCNGHSSTRENLLDAPNSFRESTPRSNPNSSSAVLTSEFEGYCALLDVFDPARLGGGLVSARTNRSLPFSK